MTKGKGKPGYEGRISNAGAQFVEAPFKHQVSRPKAKVTTGKDLRATAGNKKG